MSLIPLILVTRTKRTAVHVAAIRTVHAIHTLHTYVQIRTNCTATFSMLYCSVQQYNKVLYHSARRYAKRVWGAYMASTTMAEAPPPPLHTPAAPNLPPFLLST